MTCHPSVHCRRHGQCRPNHGRPLEPSRGACLRPPDGAEAHGFRSVTIAKAEDMPGMLARYPGLPFRALPNGVPYLRPPPLQGMEPAGICSSSALCAMSRMSKACCGSSPPFFRACRRAPARGGAVPPPLLRAHARPDAWNSLAMSMTGRRLSPGGRGHCSDAVGRRNAPQDSRGGCPCRSGRRHAAVVAGLYSRAGSGASRLRPHVTSRRHAGTFSIIRARREGSAAGTTCCVIALQQPDCRGRMGRAVSRTAERN